jgi:hypothetical protein
MRLELIRRVLVAKRAEHPELERALRWPGVRRICDREGVGLAVRRLPRPSLLTQYLGRWTIVLSSAAPVRRHTYYAAHELAHLWLHHDPTAERAQRVYTFDDWSAPDPREDEADLAATWMLGSAQVRAWLERE